jgi:hypothetical protein
MARIRWLMPDVNEPIMLMLDRWEVARRLDMQNWAASVTAA